MDSPGPWLPGKLKYERGHFMGERHPAGSEVAYRKYASDPRYIEVRLPDGYYYTADPDDIEPMNTLPKSSNRWDIY